MVIRGFCGSVVDIRCLVGWHFKYGIFTRLTALREKQILGRDIESQNEN